MFSLFIQLPGPQGTPVQIPYPTGFNTKLDTLGGTISAILPYIFIVSGLILFFAIIWSGFNLVLSGGNPEKVKGAQGCLTNAITGFIIVLASYWIIQILEYILGIKIF